ncbi:MAG: transglutaminase [Rhizobiales bacterium 35-66-30]|nr:MAG: transglutaminase [Rhizobiales bacterium 35-66-30]
MKIHAGYRIAYDCPQPTPMILTLSVHPSRVGDLLNPDRAMFDPPIPANTYHDIFGNFCHVINAPAGRLTMYTDFTILDAGEADICAPHAQQHALSDLPVDVLLYLLGSRYCETDRLSDIAWSLFGHVPKGWPLVSAICDFVHQRITFGYVHARCRCMNLPARYCTGYLGDIGVPPDGSAMDFSAWFEVYLGDRWYTFDARHNKPRVGRILMARGRDATDVAIVTSFGPCTLASFQVTADEVA